MRHVATALGVFLLPLVSYAHHSGAYYQDEIQEWVGEVVDVRWRNPHIMFTLKSVEPNGEKTIRLMEANNVYRVEQEGLTSEMLHEGITVTVAGRQSNADILEAQARNVLLPDGREFILGGRAYYWSPDERSDEDQRVGLALDDGKGLFRVWSRAVQLGRESYLPYTEAALATMSEWDPNDNYVTRCETPGLGIHVLRNPLPFELIDNGSTITFHGNQWDIVRTIHMDDQTVPADEPLTTLGYSVGTWEGDTLVVHTTRINWPYIHGGTGAPQTTAVEYLERFTIDYANNWLDYAVTIVDPETFSEPARDEQRLLALGDTMKPFNCQAE
jgi:hypothetical protein